MKEQSKVIHHSDISRIARNASISGAGEIVFNIFGYVTSVVITRTVGTSIYGVFNLANIITWIAQVFSTAGLNQGLLRFVAFYRGKEDMARLKGTIVVGTKLAFMLSLFLSLILFLFADFLSVKLFNNTEVGIAIKILAISIPFLTIGDLLMNVIQAFQAIKYQVYIQKLFQPAVKLLSVVIFFLAGLKLSAILMSNIIAAVIGFVLASYFLLKIFPVHRIPITPIYERRRLINFSVPLLLTQFLGIITFYADSIMIGYFRNASDVGVYSAVFRVALLVVLPLTAFNTIFAPIVSESFARNELQKINELFKTVTMWIFTLSLPLVLLFILFAKPIMEIFGDDFMVGASALIVLGIGELVNAGVGSAGYILTMAGRPKINSYNAAALCIVNIILNYLLIPRFGIMGAAVATGISIAVVNIARLIEVYLILKIHPYKITYFKPFIAGLLSFLAILQLIKGISHIPIFTMIVLSLLFIVIYSFLIFLLRLEEGDKYILKLVYQKIVNLKAGLCNAKEQ